MRGARFLPVLALFLASCANPLPPRPIPPPVPVPVNPPAPPTPPQPMPVTPFEIATGEAAAKVVIGMAEADVRAAMKVTPRFDSVDDDGTRLIEWAILDLDGKPKSLIVHLSAGKVIGRSRLPRSP